ncbi:MAG: abortive infection family protein [Bacteroidetes bacterium]|nr:abortive infection family protein [Bacteroidota bacterium]
MEKLKNLIDQHSRWQPLDEYIQRIEAYLKSDFSISIENSKSLLESIAKEICIDRGQSFEAKDSPAKLLKLAFGSIGIQSNTISPQIASALSTIGQFVGELRNEVGSISHGRTMEELQAKKEILDDITREFLIVSVEIISCFLIQFFEWKFPREDTTKTDEKIVYENCEDFNNFLDETYGDFTIGVLSYPASEILYNVDQQAYENDFKEFNRDQE